MQRAGPFQRRAAALCLILALAACGVEGPPQPPQAEGLVVGGTASSGVGASGG